MSWIIYAIIGTILFFYMADTTITFSPFSFKVERLSFAFGWLFLSVGIVLMQINTYNRGVHDGAKAMRDAVVEYIDSVKTNKADTTETK